MTGNPRQWRKDKRSRVPLYYHIWTMPIGKHKGKPVHSIPITYLAWMRHNSTNPTIVEKCAEEIDRRRRLSNRIV